MQEAKKVALISGANKGIGFKAVRQIAKVGWTVLAAIRNEELEALPGEKYCGSVLNVLPQRNISSMYSRIGPWLVKP